jgi:hypothetical protein
LPFYFAGDLNPSPNLEMPVLKTVPNFLRNLVGPRLLPLTIILALLEDQDASPDCLCNWLGLDSG